MPKLYCFPGSSAGKRIYLQCRRLWFNSWVMKIPGERIGYPLQYSWASLVAQLVKNSPAMQETWVQSLGWEDTLEKGMATHSSILAWRIPWTIVHGFAKSQIWLSNFSFTCQNYVVTLNHAYQEIYWLICQFFKKQKM